MIENMTVNMNTPGNEGKGVLVQNNAQEGQIVAIYCRRAQIDQPDLDRGSEVLTVELSGKCYGENDGMELIILLG